MSARSFLHRPPRPLSFALYGTAAGLLAALTFGELVWYALAPPPMPEAYTAPPASTSLFQLTVTASPKVSVYPGGTNTVAVRVARDRFDGPVTVAFAAPVPGPGAAEVTVPAGETNGQAQVAVAATAKPGVYTLTATATATADGRALSASATVEVTVVAPPPPGPRMAVSVSPTVQTYQRGKNAFTVGVARDDFDDEVVVTFDRLPAGVTVPPVTISKGKSEATAELTADASATPGEYAIAVTARSVPKGVAASAAAETIVTVRSGPKVPVDVAFALDCTGSMEKAVAGIDAALPKFATALAKAELDVRFGLVGFQDTTLGQPLQVPQMNGERMTADAARLGAAMTGLRLGGGGGAGESSLDGIAEAAKGPFREPAVRVVLLVTDGGPKKADGRMKSADEAVKYLRAKRIDQLHVVALPEHRKAFEPLWEGAKGKYFDLGAANASGDYDTPMTALAKAVSDALPARPENKPEPSAAALQPALPPVGSAQPPAQPPGAEPDEPKVEKPPAVPPESPSEPKGLRAVVWVAWSVTVAGCVCLALLAGQMTVLPGGRPSLGLGASCYGVALVVGLAAGAAGCVACGALAGPFVARLGGGCLFGFGFGLMVPLAENWFRAEPPAEPLNFDAEPVPVPAPAVVAPPVLKPAIAAPKPRDGCPGCGRTIPGAAGNRYCMVCDNTF